MQSIDKGGENWFAIFMPTNASRQATSITILVRAS